MLQSSNANNIFKKIFVFIIFPWNIRLTMSERVRRCHTVKVLQRANTTRVFDARPHLIRASPPFCAPRRSNPAVEMDHRVLLKIEKRETRSVESLQNLPQIFISCIEKHKLSFEFYLIYMTRVSFVECNLLYKFFGVEIQPNGRIFTPLEWNFTPKEWNSTPKEWDSTPKNLESTLTEKWHFLFYFL
jgi:hypothetical protein